MESGDLYEAALSAEEAARRAVQERDPHLALDLLDGVLHRVVRQKGTQDWDKLLLAMALEGCRLKIHLVRGMDDVPEILQQIQIIAERFGDRRTLARIDLMNGLLHYVKGETSRGFHFIAAGLDKADDLGDRDIMGISAEFRGIYYYLQGLYKEAVDCFDLVVRSTQLSSTAVPSPCLPEHLASSSALGYCSALLGQYHRAIGVLDSHWRRSRLDPGNRNSCFYEALLGIVLIIMGRRKEAYDHLTAARAEARELQNKPALHVVQKGLSYYHYFEGHLKEAYRMTAETVYTRAIGPQYNWPVTLEMLYAFDREGYPAIEALNFEQEMVRVINGHNLHLRGVALRIRALQAKERGENTEVVQSLLESSEADLLRTGDPVELAKTRSEMARLHLIFGDRTHARHLALMAWEGLSGYGLDFFPDDLACLLRVGVSTLPGKKRQEHLDDFMELLAEFTPQADQDELLTRITARTSQFFGAERGGLFWFSDNPEAPRPTLRSSYNLDRSEVSSESFHSAFGLIFKTYRQAKPLVIHGGPALPRFKEAASRATAVYCLPVSSNGAIKGVLYLENFYTRQEDEEIDAVTMDRIARHLSTAIERILFYTEMVERDRAKSVSAQAQMDVMRSSHRILGESAAMQSLLRRTDQAAITDANVLIAGETGVGKELLARRIHEASHRKAAPFIVVDLASIPETLVESELFGHEKGAFTGADRQKPGRVELAHQGTLFMDEIGDVPLNAQVKLLRVLQEKSFVRVGGTRTIASDFRLVAATNRDLSLDVSSGRFRQDLFYRINVLPLVMPPLRERGDDVILMAREFLNQYARKYHRTFPPLSDREIAALKAYPWPGNVRELKNVMERSAILSSPDRIELNLPACGEARPGLSFADMPSMDELQRRYIQYILALTGGRIGGPGGAAEILGMKRTTLQARMRKLLS